MTPRSTHFEEHNVCRHLGRTPQPPRQRNLPLQNPAAFGDLHTADADAAAAHNIRALARSLSHVCPGAGAPSHRPSHLPLNHVRHRVRQCGCRFEVLARRHALLHEVHAHRGACQFVCQFELTRTSGRPSQHFPSVTAALIRNPAGGFPHAGVGGVVVGRWGSVRSPWRPAVRPDRLTDSRTFRVLCAKSTPDGS
jgi:hypothetical protein